MTKSPYDILGVPAAATQDEIKKAYRKLAKTLHPDLHPDDPAKLAEFQAVSGAYELLGDAEKRRRFDAGEIDASGQERPEQQFYHQYAGRDAGARYDPRRAQAGGGGGYGEEDLSGIFSDLFGQRARAQGARQGYSARGQDLRYHLDIGFLDAARGAKRAVTMPGGKAIEISVPAGVQDGQTLRLSGKGAPGLGSGPAGDALISIAVKPHAVFTREGNDIEVELPITFDEAVLGGKVEVPTINGPVSMSIPKGASSGQRLRLKNKGIQPRGGKSGDQTVRLKIVLPKEISAQMQALAESWREAAPFDPRAEIRSKT